MIPLGLKPISLPLALGIILIIEFVTYSPTVTYLVSCNENEINFEERILKSISLFVVIPPVVLLVGWIIHFLL